MSTTETQLLQQAPPGEVKKSPDSRQNPFLKLIGSVDVEPFADNIDQELYTLPQQETALDTDQNPLLEFIGGVSHGTLAHNIDEDLASS